MPTKIEWCDETWNPITGCTPISAGCSHCYARRMAHRLNGRFGYPALPADPFAPATMHDANEWAKPDKWKRPRLIFVCSMGDLFHNSVSDGQIEMVIDDCRTYARHIFIILTKRPTRATRFRYPSNVLLGATVESQEYIDRAFALRESNARVKFLSCEPLLGPLDLREYLGQGIGWVIVGAETGPGKRPMKVEWAASIRDQCLAAGVPFFFKKDSHGSHYLFDKIWEQFPK